MSLNRTQDLIGQGELAGNLDFFADQDVDTAPEDDLGFELGAHQMRNFFGKHGVAVRAERLEAIEVQDERPIGRLADVGTQNLLALPDFDGVGFKPGR